jgi:hypothetical protein
MSDFQALLCNPTKYEAGIQTGFIVFPHSNDQPAGWGEPFYNNDGSSIEPGTPNGPNPNRLVGFAKSLWKRKKDKYHQAVGNIDWRGPWRNVKKRERRHIITVNGPSQRHWNAAGAFVYDGVEENHEVYCDGKVLSVAPLPVLGAAFCTHVDAITGETVKTLIVICKNGLVDEVYTRPYPAPVIMEELTDDVRVRMRRMADSQTNPLGWVFRTASAALNKGYAPDTPWFFNESGTQARAMRRQLVEYTDDLGVDRSEDNFVEMIMRFVPQSYTANFEDLSADALVANKITMVETMWRVHDSQWTDVIADAYGVYHLWEENWVEGKWWSQGKHKVAVDWDSDRSVWVYAWLEFSTYHGIQQQWSYGIDPNGTNHPNNGNTQGKRYPPNSVPNFMDHAPMVALGATDFVYLLIGTNPITPDLKFYLGWGLQRKKTRGFTSGIRVMCSCIMWICGTRSSLVIAAMTTSSMSGRPPPTSSITMNRWNLAARTLIPR